MAIQKWPDGLPRSVNLQFDQLESVSDWFDIHKINHETYALLEPHHDEEVISFLLLGNDRAALIDTGMGVSNILAEVKRITSLPVVVVNTHTHFDHTGDNFRFEEIACFDNRFELKNLKEGHSHQFCKGFMQPGSYRNLPPGFDPMAYRITSSRVTQKIKHLDQLDLGNRIITIHHTPGHSPGSICVEDLKYGILFTGDTYYRGTLLLHLPGSNYIQFVKTIEYLQRLLDRIKSLCPSHNECVAPKEDIILLHKAMEKINSEQLNFDINNQSRFYQFEHFNIRLPLMDH